MPHPLADHFCEKVRGTLVAECRDGRHAPRSFPMGPVLAAWDLFLRILWIATGRETHHVSVFTNIGVPSYTPTSDCSDHGMPNPSPTRDHHSKHSEQYNTNQEGS